VSRGYHNFFFRSLVQMIVVAGEFYFRSWGANMIFFCLDCFFYFCFLLSIFSFSFVTFLFLCRCGLFSLLCFLLQCFCILFHSIPFFSLSHILCPFVLPLRGGFAHLSFWVVPGVTICQRFCLLFVFVSFFLSFFFDPYVC